jgi:hypothetical protein
VITLTHADLLGRLHYDPDTGVFTWRVYTGAARPGNVAGMVGPIGYRYIGIARRLYPAHRLAWFYVHGEWPPQDIDHINMERADNRLANLRLATRSQNMANGKARVGNRSGFKGVFFHKQAGKWTARLTVNGRCRSLGFHATPEAAHAAYVSAAKQAFGDFAREN